MNKYGYLLSLSFLTFFSNVSAQEPEEKNERIQAQKVAFITERINLTSREAQVFWPVYNEYQEKKDKINVQRRTTREYYKKNARTLSDKEADELLNKYISIEQQEITLLIEYNDKFKQVLSPKKVMQLYIAENQFKAWLLNKLRNPGPSEINDGRRK